jgi:hypothetical protein
MSRAHMEKGEDSRRLGKQHQAKEAAGWAEVSPGRPTQPNRGPITPPPPFDIACIRTIYSLEGKNHASILSSFAVDE